MGGRFVFALLALLPTAALAEDGVAYTPPDFLSATPPLPSTIDASTAWRLDLGEATLLPQNQRQVEAREAMVERVLHRLEIAPHLFQSPDQGKLSRAAAAQEYVA